MKINFGRALTQVEQLGAINRTADGSCCRLALTDADKRGRDLVISWMREAELDVRIDRIGNILGLRAGMEDGPPIMTGSHIDSVATGGLYDGAYGVLAGLEVVRTLNDAGKVTRRPLAVAVFTNEEGVRFQPDMMGSLVFAGGLSLTEALASVAVDGPKLMDELVRSGYAGEMECGAIRPRAFVELHIEQGPILDSAREHLGVVENLQGISWQEIAIRGTSNHAGTTPMALRHDAAHCAAAIMVFVRELAHRMGGAQVATVGSIRVKPDLVNVIAREAWLTVDLRNTDDERLEEARGALADFLVELAEREGVDITVKELARSPSVRFDPDIVSVIEAAARDLGHAGIRRMTSGAGHDAQMLARVCPAAMIFVPSIGGISHNPREATANEDLATGIDVLFHTLLRLADG